MTERVEIHTCNALAITHANPGQTTADLLTNARIEHKPSRIDMETGYNRYRNKAI
jgi:hypothetical protein